MSIQSEEMKRAFIKHIRDLADTLEKCKIADTSYLEWNLLDDGKETQHISLTRPPIKIQTSPPEYAANIYVKYSPDEVRFGVDEEI